MHLARPPAGHFFTPSTFALINATASFNSFRSAALCLRSAIILNDDKDPVISRKGSTMVHHPVRSSRIASIGYDARSAILEIRFLNRTLLQYQPVPARIYNDFLLVVSKGRFYDGVIKGKFKERRIY